MTIHVVCVFGYTGESYEIFINTPHTISVKKSQIQSFLFETLTFQTKNLILLKICQPVTRNIGLR